MCIYTVKKQEFKKKSSMGVCDTTERLKIRCLRRREYPKIKSKVFSIFKIFLKIIFTWLKESYQRKKTLSSTCI